ncbi:MAG: glycosyltransferase family 2 protein [Dorea sp.]
MQKVSIIVPVYNVERYLERCVDSLVHQSYTDIEILLINDGSTDSSGSICKKIGGGIAM